MSDDGEIEFLDEDADIVSQYVQAAENLPVIEIKREPMEITSPESLLEEKPKRKTKRKKEADSDYEYNPSEDLALQRNKKRKYQTLPRHSSRVSMLIERKPKKYVSKFDFIDRKKIVLKIPDYDDPLCLPVRALKQDQWDIKKLRNWNNLCLEHFKQFDTPLRAENQPTIASKRTIIMRNIKNKATGIVDTTMYSRICVENAKEDKRSEVVQSVLPKYAEKKELSPFQWSDEKKKRQFSQKDEVLMTKEVNKDEETLVVYKPEQKLSLVYKMFIHKGNAKIKDDEDTKYLKEIASCKVCAPCYQTSWRGFKKISRKNIFCNICNRPCISVYNFLSHLKSHPDEEVKSKVIDISKRLAAAMDYHYKCRICHKLFPSIKELRIHINTHQGNETFKCEVGNHMTT